MKITIGIYKITNPTDSIYIGQSKNTEKRLKSYKGGHCLYQKRLKRSIDKYGWALHKFEILEVCKIEELDSKEIYYINLFQTFNTEKGMNLLSGGRGKGLSISDETRLRMSQSQKGKKLGKNNGMAKEVYQYTLTGEYIKKFDTVKDASVSCNKDPDSCVILNAAKGKLKTAYGYQWRREYKGEFIAKVLPGSDLRRIKGKKGTYSKPITLFSKIDDTVIKKYNSIKEASKDTGMSTYNIAKFAKILDKKIGKGRYWRLEKI